MSAAEPSLVPHIWAAGTDGDTAYLVRDVTDRLAVGRLSNAGQRELGLRLARMHKNGRGDRFGFHVATHCGATKLDNTWTDDWKTFFTERRLGDIIKRIGDRELTEAHERLQSRAYSLLFDSIDPQPEPTILHDHADLGYVRSELAGAATSGVRHGLRDSADRAEDPETGEPFMFDPSSFYGHSEFELGIMRMFGGFSSAFFDAVLPKSEGPHEQRLQLYEAFHHLNHALMFGGSYGYSALRLLTQVADWADAHTRRTSSAT